MWISLCTGAAVFLFTIAIGGNATRKLGRIENEDEWLFTNGFSKIYDACLENQDPEKMTAKLGMSYDKYNRNCRILRYVPDWKKEAGMRIVGILIVLISLVAALLLKNILIGLVGITVFFFLGPYQEHQISSRAKIRRKRLAEDLPRFIDLFQTAVEIGVPVESAIKITAQDIPCVVSEELLLVMAETELGAKSWQRALEEVALKYDVSVFSDFVLALVAAYEKGIPISEIVSRKSMEIKQINLLDAKERAAKLSNTVLLPVMVFKILPLLAIMLIPIMMQIASM